MYLGLEMMVMVGLDFLSIFCFYGLATIPLNLIQFEGWQFLRVLFVSNIFALGQAEQFCSDCTDGQLLYSSKL